MKIIAYNADNGGCYHYRLFLPFQKMLENGYDVRIQDSVKIKDLTGKDISKEKLVKVQKYLEKHPGKEAEYIVPEYDCYTFQRSNMKGALQNSAYLKKRGKKFVYETDDWLFGIEKSNPCYDTYMNDESQRIMGAMANHADAVTVSTEFLAKGMRKFNPNVFILPNSLDLKAWEKFREARAQYQRTRKDNKIRVGYAGSATHLQDFKIIKDVLPHILRKNPNVIMKFIGFDWSKPLEENVPLFSKEFEGLENQIETVGWADMDSYPLNLIDLDIGLAPLADNTFNRCKSNLKWLEYSALNIPTIASNVEPYKCIEQGQTGIKIFGNNEKSWIKELNWMINSTAGRKRIGENARGHIEAFYDIADNWKMWAEAYTKINEVKSVDQILTVQ